MPEIASAAEAPSNEAMSGSTSELTDSTEATTCTSLVKPSGKQRPDRPIDQARGQRFLLGGPAFALEEAAGNAARGVGLLLIIDGQGKEIAARRRLLQAHRGHQHHSLAHGHEHRAVGLTRELARLDGYGVIAILKTFLG